MVEVEEGVLQMSAYEWELVQIACLFGRLKLFIALIYSRDIATLHVDCRDTNNSKKDIQGLTMAFNLPYFLVYQETITFSGSVESSSVRSNTGQLVFQVGKRSISK